MEKPLWFRAKRYGYGWYPCSWQGWTVLFVWLVLIVNDVIRFDMVRKTGAKDDVIFFIADIVILTALLIVICVMKGEKARWRWGGK